MYSNSPSHLYYRLAELRSHEEMITAAERRRQGLLQPANGPLNTLQSGLGHLLIAAGNHLVRRARRQAGAREPIAA